MKASTRLLFLLIFVFVTINTFPQNGIKKDSLKRAKPYGIREAGLKKAKPYGIREAGLKSAKAVVQTFTSVNNFGVDKNIKSKGVVVAGAVISIKLQQSNTPVARVITDENGEFGFDVSKIPDFPKQGTFIFEVTPPKTFAKRKEISKANKKFKVNFVTPGNGNFNFLLFLASPGGPQDMGGFAVSGRSGT